MNTPIPFFSLDRQWNEIKKTVEPLVIEVLNSNLYVGGKYVKGFEEKLASFLDCKNIISCNSGTDALWLALKALGLSTDDIVLTTPFSFIASCSEIVAHKAHPVFIDIDKDTFNISPEKIEEWLNKNATHSNGKTIHKETGFPVKGILAVNIFGQCADFKKIREIAEKWNLWIVEDAAQSIGSHIENQKSGTLGDITTFSFYPTKNLGACGDGGAATTNDPELAERLVRLRNHGRHSHYSYTEYGINSRLDGIQAAILTEKLNFIDSWNKKRRENAERYRQNLQDIDKIKLPVEQTGYHTYHQFCTQINNEKDSTLRDKLAKHLTDNNIGYNIFYPESFTEIKFLQTNDKLKNECPVALHATKTVLALPIWPELTNEEIDHICDTIKEFFAKEC